jgi:IS5 family transposase
MGFKKTTRNLDFADLAMATCLEQNRSIKLMEQLNNTINWARVESIKGYAGKPNRDFLALNQIEDGIMRKNSTTAKPTDSEILRNKAISKIRYIVEQYFCISHLHDRANRARFTTIVKNKFDTWFRQAAFNVARGMKILSRMTV